MLLPEYNSGRGFEFFGKEDNESGLIFTTVNDIMTEKRRKGESAWDWEMCMRVR